jgi:uncharacterized protein (DUF362 family)/Pyruvate/2-oxoacid:ferredoxin oxidoreductase delta subunit
MKTTVSLFKCSTYETAAVEAAVRKAVDALGGIRAFVHPGERILLKPNLLSAKEPARHITTHPEVVRAVIRLVKEAGATPVIGDSPGGAIKGIDRVWEKTGMKQLAAEEGVTLINFETSGATEKKIDHPLLGSINIANAILEVDGIINLPKLKTHALMLYTGALKNFYGAIPGLRKAEYHKLVPFPEDFGRLIGEIYLQVKDRLRFTLIDGIVGMEGNGPSSGDLRKLEMIIAGSDAVALDTAATALLGFKPMKIDALKYLASKNVGTADLSQIEIKGDAPSSFALGAFKFPSNWYIRLVPRFLVKALGKLIWMKPYILPAVCRKCMLCVNSCPVKAIHVQENGVPAVENEPCISCLCCHELCPCAAVELRSSRLSKLVIRQ